MIPGSRTHLAAALAATDFAERVTNHLKATDQEGLKRLLDRAAQQLEDALTRADGASLQHAAATAELVLIRKVFATLG